jgi:outer membrane protein OmpA-like peptidoglycan-associated protein
MNRTMLAFVAFACAAGSATLMALPVHAGSEAPGTTNLMNAKPDQIQPNDLIQALTVGRQTAIVPSAKPKVLLPINFESGSAELTAQSKQLLDRLIQALQSPDLQASRFKIEGHTDSIGSAPYNQGLSERRAHSVSAYLEAGGVPASRLQTVGRGMSDPIADNATAEGRRQNRRVEVINVGTSS